MKKIFSLCVLLGMFSSAAFADIRLPETPSPTPAPKAKKAIETYLNIRIEKDAKEARLLIPKDQLKQLRAQLDELDNDSNASAFLSFSRSQTIVSGLFLSLAFIFGGVWLTRSRKATIKPNKTIIAGVGLFLCGGLATIVFANVGPPIEARSITGRLFTPAVHQYKQASGKIKLETTDESSGVQLIVPDVPSDKKADE